MYSNGAICLINYFLKWVFLQCRAAREYIQLLIHGRQHVQEPGVLPALPAGDGCSPQPLDPQPGEDSQPPPLELQLNIPGAEAKLKKNLQCTY
jgi:hypothetical protein